MFDQKLKKEHKRSCKFFGKKDGSRELQVGKWFPRQLAAALQGYHGNSQAGIHGASKLGGANSIVISGSYLDVNGDRGDVISCPGPESKTQEKGDPVTLSEGSAQVMVNLSTKQEGNPKPVRVFRAVSKSDAEFAPVVGLRYDGLYDVTDADITDVNVKCR
ncbi:hypothetical protein AC578_3379 [Pseudocercospora eumusae]|uniref:YDG domain-containing protein n=1 Tax=Pseudocercospora eumusae TaxID=321146 RepID=A0A139GV43_9PEZI|nr:hypothetical protein AC578_3379 [Pseudocercospora eumusae]